MWCAQNMASRIPDPTPNQIARPYSSLSVQDVDIDLTTAALTTYLMGREAYYQTEYLALRNGPDVALVAVRKQSAQPLFSPIVDVRVLAEPAEAACCHETRDGRQRQTERGGDMALRVALPT